MVCTRFRSLCEQDLAWLTYYTSDLSMHHDKTPLASIAKRIQSVPAPARGVWNRLEDAVIL